MANTRTVVGTILRVAVIAAIAFAIIGEEQANNKFAHASEEAATKGAPVAFGADVSKVLSILIRSLYTNRDIFLREIISNGSDALDKSRFNGLTKDKNSEVKMDIRIKVDEEKRTVTITDGGVGMSKAELEKNLGSLGTSGTKDFLEKMAKQSEDGKSEEGLDQIGQFGVGFYSSFLISDRVVVSSKSEASDKQMVWESTGDGTFFVYEDDRNGSDEALVRGTEITLHLKRDADEYLDVNKLKDIVHRYSEFIHFPIYMQTKKTEKVAKAKPEGDETAEPVEPVEGEDADEKKPEAETEEEMEEVTTYDWEVVNENKPIWVRKHSEITEAEFHAFYKSMTKDYAEPMYYEAFAAEGGVEFSSILFVPGKAPTNIYDPTAQTSNNIRLYVRRVFITDEFRDLLPRYLNFIKGVVDSDDLPLVVSRENLQENRILKVIKKKLVRKALAMISAIAESDVKFQGEDEDAEDTEDVEIVQDGKKQLKVATYAKFWEEYGKNIRLGMIEDGNNRARLTKLLRYKTSKSEEKLVSFQEYVDRMAANNKKDGAVQQKSIYYISGESIEKIKQAPVLEDATKRDIEVIYMIDSIDEYVVGHITDFSGKKLVNLAKEGVSFDGDETKKDKQIHNKRLEKYEPLFKYFRDLLGEKITKVVLTKRKTSEPIILSSRQHDITARMASIMKGQALGDARQDPNAATVKRVMEINHLHPLVDEIFSRIQADAKDTTAEDLGLVLFDTANLQNGFDIEDTLAYSRRINRLLRASVDIAPDAPLVEEDVSQYEITEEDDDDEEQSEDAPMDDAPMDDDM